MRENRTSGLMRGSNGIGDSRPLLSTLLAIPFAWPCLLPQDYYGHKKHKNTQKGYRPD
jgi:hypothetical protein